MRNKQKCKLKLHLSSKVQYKEILFGFEVEMSSSMPNIWMKYLIEKVKKCFYWDLKYDIKDCIWEWKIKLRNQEVFLQGFQVSYSRMYIINKFFFDINLKNLLGPLFQKLIRPKNGSLQYILGIYMITCKSQNLRQ